MAVRVHKCANQLDAAQAEANGVADGFALVDVGTQPTQFQYFEGPDTAAPKDQSANCWVVVLTDDV